MYQDLLTTVLPFENDLFRNIKSARNSIDCYDDLGDGDLDTRIAVDAEMIGHEPSYAPTITRPFDYGLITYPFVLGNAQQTRFSEGREFGVWYGALEMETTIFETIHHWRRTIEDSFPDHDDTIISERRVCLAFCSALLIDLRGKEMAWPGLIDPVSYRFTNELGRYLHGHHQNGLLVKSARCAGTNAAIFTPDVLSNPRDLCYLTYSWNPVRDRQIQIERTPGVTLMSIPI